MALTEKQFQQQVIDLAELFGWTVRHIGTATRQVRGGRHVPDAGVAGIPDLILVKDRLVWAELKTEKGKLRPAQVDYIERLRAAGQEVYVWRPSDFDELTGVLSGQSSPHISRTASADRAVPRT